MINRILLPIDFVEESQRAVDSAIELGTPGTTEIRLLHVVETLHEIGYEEMKSFYDELARKATEKLEELGQRLSEEGFLVHSEVSFGKRSAMIVRSALTQEIDLIIVHTHRISESRPTGSLGTLAHQIALLAPCSVMLVRN